VAAASSLDSLTLWTPATTSQYQNAFLENELVTRIENKLRIKHRAHVKADK
jgi:hypothetical protein